MVTRVTEFIPEIVNYVQTIVDNGCVCLLLLFCVCDVLVLGLLMSQMGLSISTPERY